jgi:hypothetical protein
MNTQKRCEGCKDKEYQCVACWSYEMALLYPGKAWND